QLKGAGPTPFSRRGDGRAALGPVLREYIVSEAMFALGIPTTRALAAVTTGEPVFRESALPGAVLTRVASSHMRVGTFEYFAAREDKEALATLTRHALERHYPDSLDAVNPALALLDRVIGAQASLVASWLGVGFVHGVMNTDNTSIAGETIDYGPCAFLDEYDPRKTFSSIDQGGRYAFMNQPRIAQWNLVKLAECLLPLIADDEDEAAKRATDLLNAFGERFDQAFGDVMRNKIGLEKEKPGDFELAMDLLACLAKEAVDFTILFRTLASGDAKKVAALFSDPAPFRAWADRWRARLAEENATPESRSEAMRRANPAYIPRNHRVEQAIAAAIENDFAPFETLVRVLAHPFDDQPDAAHLAEAPLASERVRQTFCGT
ncbi:MAG: protein adenylyltransferase SelO, partial [Polyangiaceae bacterium]